MNMKDYTEANRQAWNQVNPIHQKNREKDLSKEVKKDDFTALADFEIDKFNEINLSGKHIAHICCNNGIELISLLKMEAEYGCGFDISDEAIKEACNLSKIANVNAEFIRTDVYDIGKKFHNQFDIVYITVGALCWLPDIRKAFDIISNLLKNNGILFICEMHPLTNMLSATPDEVYDQKHPIELKFSYFNTEPWIDDDGLDYIGKTTYKASPAYTFGHTLSSIFNAIITNGLVITEFNEYPKDISNVFSHIKVEMGIPLSYILISKKVN